METETPLMLLFVCNGTDHSSIISDTRQMLDLAYDDIETNGMMPEEFDNKTSGQRDHPDRRRRKSIYEKSGKNLQKDKMLLNPILPGGRNLDQERTGVLLDTSLP